ncbi:MAG TPA: RNA methyltransferase [Geobacteraceae bacterium]|nr:RNA methyltransferase [Geobacteraceae bacterium]
MTIRDLELRERVAIVLVEPQSPGNIGMVCRAMKNMGTTDLRMVNPCVYDHPEAHKFAVSARDVLERATIFSSLPEALADSPFSIGTTRRHGKYRPEIITPEQVARKILPELGQHRAAFVFGREDNGLTTDELSLCRWHATIPSATEYGSLNLAQSVLIFCYELFKSATKTSITSGRGIATVEQTEELYRHMEDSLLRIGYLNPQNPAHIMRAFRRMFARAELDSREVALLRGMMSQIDWATGSFSGRKTP